MVRLLFTALTCLSLLSGSGSLAAQEAAARSYMVKPSEVVVPSDVPIGQYRRMIRPFDNWTLICDENLQARTMVCNVSQIIIDQLGQTAFSWSLAATADGKPFMIIRVPITVGTDSKVTLAFPGRNSPVEVALSGCNDSVCMGTIPVGPILREHIDKASSATISYLTNAGERVTLKATLKGLSAAVAAIK